MRSYRFLILTYRRTYCSVSTNNENAVAAQESAEIFEEETPNKVKKVELEIQSEKEDSSTSTNSDVGEFLVRVTPGNIRSNTHVHFYFLFFFFSKT